MADQVMEMRVFATLRDLIGGSKIECAYHPGTRILDLLNQAFEQYPQLKPEVLDEEGELNNHVHVFVNGRDIRYLHGLQTPVAATDKIRIFPPVGGGLR